MSPADYPCALRVLYDWQTIITGAAAIFGGWLAYRAGTKQAKATLEGAGQQIAAVRSTLQANTLLQLTDKFDSPEFQGKQKKAAQACLANLATKNPGVDVDDVLDFFEDLAFMVTNGALDERMMWHGFHHWVRVYYQASEQYIISRRREEPAVWYGLCEIYPRLNALEKAEIEKAKNGITYKEKLSDAEIKKDLDDILT